MPNFFENIGSSQKASSLSECYYNRMPFSVGVLEGSLYEDNSIKDEQIVLFERISMLLNRLIQKEEPIKALDYIKHSYSLHYDYYAMTVHTIRSFRATDSHE